MTTLAPTEDGQQDAAAEVAPPPQRFDDSKNTEALAQHLAKAVRAAVLQIEYSDTSDAASVSRFEARTS